MSLDITYNLKKKSWQASLDKRTVNVTKIPTLLDTSERPRDISYINKESALLNVSGYKDKLDKCSCFLYHRRGENEIDT